VGSIRWRILKELEPAPHQVEVLLGYSGLDPMEDTESGLGQLRDSLGRGLQWARSDGGY